MATININMYANALKVLYDFHGTVRSINHQVETIL
jgi:hypothetical protein